jgi:hypothetical protein
MEYIVGISLALFVCSATTWLGMDRDRVFYPTVVVVVATYCVLFAVIMHNTGVPSSWPGFCMTYDVTAAAFVALLMVLRAGSKRKLQSQHLSARA